MENEVLRCVYAGMQCTSAGRFTIHLPNNSYRGDSISYISGVDCCSLTLVFMTAHRHRHRLLNFHHARGEALTVFKKLPLISAVVFCHLHFEGKCSACKWTALLCLIGAQSAFTMARTLQAAAMEAANLTTCSNSRVSICYWRPLQHRDRESNCWPQGWWTTSLPL